MERIEHYYEMIDNIIKGFGVDPSACKSETPGQWNLKKGSAPVWVDVWKMQDQEYGYLQIMAPICEVPVNNQHLFTKELLEINHQLYGVAFTIYKEWAYLKMIRELDGLDESEALAMFNRIGNYADQYDDILKNKYGLTNATRG
ncbi:MAG TPA: YbjN domain-containing protein [Bacteroidia bacterium]|jgi:hypothetical protein